jgi:hypothetical protein
MNMLFKQQHNAIPPKNPTNDKNAINAISSLLAMIYTRIVLPQPRKYRPRHVRPVSESCPPAGRRYGLAVKK